MTDLDELVELAAQLRSPEIRGFAEDEARDLLARFQTAYQPQMVNYQENCIWFRAVKCSAEGFQSLHRCIYLPSGSPNLGRANLKNRPVLYAAWNVNTALEEVRAETGDYVQLIGFNVQPGRLARCVNLGDIQRRQNSGRSLFDDPSGDIRINNMVKHNPQKYQLCLYIDTVLAELFRRQSDVPADHFLTATVADAFHRGNISVLYPSVRTMHALNIAIPGCVFDDTFQVLLAEVHHINRNFGDGIHLTTRLKQSTTFAKDGTIDWSEWMSLNTRIGKYGALEPAPGTVGWRVQRPPSSDRRPSA